MRGVIQQLDPPSRMWSAATASSFMSTTVPTPTSLVPFRRVRTSSCSLHTVVPPPPPCTSSIRSFSFARRQFHQWSSSSPLLQSPPLCPPPAIDQAPPHRVKLVPTAGPAQCHCRSSPPLVPLSLCHASPQRSSHVDAGRRESMPICVLLLLVAPDSHLHVCAAVCATVA
jgi:hypothetical protein